MTDASRRNFLLIAGAGAAAVGTAVVAPTAAAAVPRREKAANSEGTQLPDGADAPMVAYIKNPKTGELSVMSGEREVVVHDRELVARLAHKLT
jgi:hypothetical protein